MDKVEKTTLYRFIVILGIIIFVTGIIIDAFDFGVALIVSIALWVLTLFLMRRWKK